MLVFGDRIQVSPGVLAMEASGLAALVAGVILVGRSPALSSLGHKRPDDRPPEPPSNPVSHPPEAKAPPAPPAAPAKNPPSITRFVARLKPPKAQPQRDA